MALRDHTARAATQAYRAARRASKSTKYTRKATNMPAVKAVTSRGRLAGKAMSNHPYRTMAGGAALYGAYSGMPNGTNTSRRNQSSRALRQIRSNQAAQFGGLEGTVNPGTPHSSGGYA